MRTYKSNKVVNLDAASDADSNLIPHSFKVYEDSKGPERPYNFTRELLYSLVNGVCSAMDGECPQNDKFLTHKMRIQWRYTKLEISQPCNKLV